MEITVTSFKCRAAFALGITSLMDFVQLVTKYKAAADAGVAYITASTFSLPKKKDLLIFDSVREVIRMHAHIKPQHTIVVSDTPVLLKEITELVPLDWDNNRSFEFSFKEPNVQLVLRALKSKQEVECKLVSFDNLGYHVNKARGSGTIISTYVALTSSMPFDKRSVLRTAIVQFFKSKNADFSIIEKSIKQLSKNFAFDKDADEFLEAFKQSSKKYHAAVNSKDAASVAAKKFGLDAFSLSYFKKFISQDELNHERYRKHNVQLKATRK